MFIRYKICFISSSYLLPVDGRDSHFWCMMPMCLRVARPWKPRAGDFQCQTQESPDKPG